MSSNRGRQAGKVESAMLKRAKTAALGGQSGCCRYCFAPLTAKDATADHLVPRSKGGFSTGKNIVAACSPCNNAKGSLNVLSFTRAIKAPRSGAPFAIWSAWARRRIWLATHRATRNIRRSVGLENDTPVGRRAAA